MYLAKGATEREGLLRRSNTCVTHHTHVTHVQAKGAAEREGPVQGRLYRSLKLWTFYCDLEESLGTQESTRVAYDRIMELRIATPQIVLNYAAFLQVCCLLVSALPELCLHVFLAMCMRVAWRGGREGGGGA